MQHSSRATSRLRKTKMDGSNLRFRRLNFFHSLDLFALTLSLSCFGVLRAEPINKCLQLRYLALLIFECGQLLITTRGSLCQVRLVVALVVDQFSPVELHDFFYKRIKEGAIVRNQDDGAALSSKLTF